jgi:Protein of unknown function (DUF3006).
MDFSVYVDQIEAGVARLTFEDEECVVSWPVECLPEGVKEGEWLRFSISSDLAKAESVFAENMRLRQELMGEKNDEEDEI